MLIEVMKSKIHRVRVTQAELNYVGSITIDEDLMDAANIVANEKVQIVNNNNGARLETYVIPGERGTGTICLNGAAARLVQVGDIIIIISYASMTPEEARIHKPSLLFPDHNNKLTLYFTYLFVILRCIVPYYFMHILSSTYRNLTALLLSVCMVAIITSSVVFMHKEVTSTGEIVTHIHPYDFTQKGEPQR